MVSCILQGPREVHGQTEKRGRERGAGVEGVEQKLVDHTVLNAKVTAAKAALIHQQLKTLCFDFSYTPLF